MIAADDILCAERAKDLGVWKQAAVTLAPLVLKKQLHYTASECSAQGRD